MIPTYCKLTAGECVAITDLVLRSCGVEKNFRGSRGWPRSTLWNNPVDCTAMLCQMLRIIIITHQMYHGMCTWCCSLIYLESLYTNLKDVTFTQKQTVSPVLRAHVLCVPAPDEWCGPPAVWRTAGSVHLKTNCVQSILEVQLAYMSCKYNKLRRTRRNKDLQLSPNHNVHPHNTSILYMLHVCIDSSFTQPKHHFNPGTRTPEHNILYRSPHRLNTHNNRLGL